jgi:hypothetical protein
MNIIDIPRSEIAYSVGYLFAILAWIPISALVNRMRKHVPQEELRRNRFLEEFIEYQRAFIGIIERILYISCLLAGYGYFIAFWITLKMGSSLVYDFWKKGLPGRVSYVNTVFGNGLSLLYAMVGYKLIFWIMWGQWCLPIASASSLVFVSYLFWFLLGRLPGKKVRTKSY